jgi:hypothetical protein
MRGWIRISLLTSACALIWACGRGSGPIFPNANPNVVSAAAIVGRGTVDTSTNQIASSAPLERGDIGVVDSESTTDASDSAVGNLAMGADVTGLPTLPASAPGSMSAPQPEGSASGDQPGAIMIINVGANKRIHVLGDSHGRPLIIIVASADTVAVAGAIVRRDSSITVRAESAATNRVRGPISS